MSYRVAARSPLTASATVGLGAVDTVNAEDDSSSSIEAASDGFSVKPSPVVSAAASYALIRSTYRSNWLRMRSSARAP